MDLHNLEVAVIGGGIGGMAAAAALARAGARVCVYEQSPVLGEVGAGLQVSVNGQHVLHAIGATNGEAPAEATVSSGTSFRTGRTGRQVAHVPAPLGGATWYLHRADLLALVCGAAERAGVRVELDRVVSPGTVQADLIIAADGVRSVWRSGVDGPVTPQFTGNVAWRALVPMTRKAAPSASLSMGHRAHVVSYPLRHGRLMNLVAVEERNDWTEDSWSQTGDPEEFRRRFQDFLGGVAGEAIAQAEAVHCWALHARNVAHCWHKGNVVLLGDAAHPTLPFMAQGACLALEDAAVLANVLQASVDLPAGLARYEALRKPRARAVVDLARGNAWRFHMGWPLNWGAYASLALGAKLLARRLEWVYGYDPTAQV